MSEKLNYVEDLESGNTFVLSHGFNDLGAGGRLVKVCYFLLTTLSTVGYGDLYPISKMEQIITLIVMMGGVAHPDTADRLLIGGIGVAALVVSIVVARALGSRQGR